MDYSFLISCYEKMLELEIVENEFIKSENWEKLNTFSIQKDQIIEKIQDFESKNPDWKKGMPHPLQVLICKVADLEQLNQNLVTVAIGQKRTQLDDLNFRTRRLNQLRLKYETLPKPDSFSGRA